MAGVDVVKTSHKSTQYNYYIQSRVNSDLKKKDKSTICNLKPGKSSKCVQTCFAVSALLQSRPSEPRLSYFSESVPVGTVGSGSTVSVTKEIKTSKTVLKDAKTQCYILPSLDSAAQKSANESKSIGTQCNFSLKEKLETPEQNQSQLPKFEDKVIQTNIMAAYRSVSNCAVQTVSGDDSMDLPTDKSLIHKIMKILHCQEYSSLRYKVKKLIRGEFAIEITSSKVTGIFNDERDPISVTVTESGKICLSILFKEDRIDNILNLSSLDEGKLQEYIQLLLFKPEVNNKVFCTGVDKNKINELPLTRVINNPKILKIITPTLRYQSSDCPVIFSKTQPVRGEKYLEKCQNCRLLQRNLSRVLKRKIVETPTRNLKQTRISSNYPLSFLSPKSRKVRLNRAQSARRFIQEKLNKLQALIKEKDINLNDNQSNELSHLVKLINSDHPEKVDDIINETCNELPSSAEVLKTIWKRDSEKRHHEDVKNFFQDQIKNKSGSKQNRWNIITYRIALAIYTRSKAAFEAIRDFGILQLPSLDTVRAKAKKYDSEPGIDFKYMKDQSEKYSSFRNEKISKGEKEPLGEGVLIFDEVKVIDQVIWNSKSHAFMGLAMTEEEFPSLHDVFSNAHKKTPTAAQYILQFLWRDMSSNFDVIGPYYSSSYSVNIFFMMTNLYEVIRIFEQFNFKVIGLVCDGASSNLSLMKLTMNTKGAFGYKKENGKYNFDVSPKFKHPFAIDRYIYWITCPTHDLKNFIGQLYASREDGPKDFTRKGVKFGWKQIEDLYKREEERAKNGQMRFVPRLLKSYIIRDAWTKLNVKPSKIMQQPQVLSELYTHSQDSSATKDSRSGAMQCYLYLQACNKLFENGLLNKGKIDCKDSLILKSIREGYTFFEEWASELLNENSTFQPNKATQTEYISWQTWDLLRICVFGMEGLALDFLSRNRGYFISPSRINGSAVESLFAQFKYSTGSKLSSVNYSHARKAVTVRANITGRHSSNKDYRDAPLYIRSGDL